MAAKLKKGDKVVVLAGKDKGKQGEITRVMPQDNKAIVEIQKGSEIVTLTIDDGQKLITSRTAVDDHGGNGFCQREAGESFSTCFKAETDEFCDSFISCIALATQPAVSIVIALACSCHAAN